MKNKLRLSASIDADLMAAVEEAVSREKVTTVSAWVNEAIRLKIEHDRRLQALGAFIREYEERHGEITTDEMQAASRRLRGRADTIRDNPSPRRRAR